VNTTDASNPVKDSIQVPATDLSLDLDASPGVFELLLYNTLPLSSLSNKQGPEKDVGVNRQGNYGPKRERKQDLWVNIIKYMCII
jgi:hypothetical protein